jgi:hypothetical protein
MTEEVDSISSSCVGGSGPQWPPDESIQHKPPSDEISTLIIEVDRGIYVEGFSKYLQKYYPNIKNLWVCNNFITYDNDYGLEDLYRDRGLVIMVVTMADGDYNVPVSTDPEGFVYIIGETNEYYKMGDNFTADDAVRELWIEWGLRGTPDNIPPRCKAGIKNLLHSATLHRYS